MKVIIGLILVACVTACTGVEKKPNQGGAGKVYGASIGIVNHTEKYIYSATVGGGGGGNAYPYSAGIPNICCATLPDNWHPGLMLLVRWDMPIGRTHVYKEQMIEVEKYEEPGSIYLHFFPNDTVRIVVTNKLGGLPDHPIAPPVKPRSFVESKGSSNG